MVGNQFSETGPANHKIDFRPDGLRYHMRRI